MSWLKDVLTKTIKIAGIEQVSRRALNFVAGDGIEITAEDDDAGKVTHLTIAATGEGSGGDAEDITYDNSSSGLGAENVQDAIDEVDERINSVQQLADELDDTCAKIASISVAANHTITDADYSGADPATTALVVNVTAAATVTLPEDPAEGQTITLVKSGTAEYLVTVSSGAEPFQALINGGVQGSVADHELNGGYAPLLASQFAATWQYRSGGWCAVSVPRQHAFMTSGGLRLNGYSIPCKPDADTGAGSALVFGEATVLRRLTGGNLTSGKVVEELCTFQSSDSKLTLDQVSSSAQLTGTITTGNDSDLAGPTNVANGEYVRIAWTVLLTISGVDYVADYVVAYKRASGTLTVIQEHAVFAAPPSVTITAAISGANQPELNIANATGADLTYYVHHSTARQVK